VHGTASADAAVAYIESRLVELGFAPRRQPFAVPGWWANGAATVAVLAPERRRLDAHTMLLSPGTPAGGEIHGRVGDVGRLGLWGGQHAWRKFAVIRDESRPSAFLCGRSNGPAIPQLLPPGSADIPHVVVGTDDTRRIEGWLAAGETVEVTVSSPAAVGPSIEAHNVHAVILGRGAGRVVVVAHYDSVWSSPGAYDNASGVAVVLETAARLAAAPLDATVDVLLTGGEELGLLGATAFVDERAAAGGLDAISYVLNVEGMGRGSLLDVWAGPENFEWTVAQAIRALPGARELTLRSTFPPPPGSDHAPFYDAGIPVAMVTFDDQEVLHSPRDLPNDEVMANMRLGADMIEHLLRKIDTAVSGW